MQVFTTRSTMQTFNGVDLDQRFARDDVDELVIRERDLHSPVQADTDQDDPMPPPDTDGDEQQSDKDYWKGM